MTREELIAKLNNGETLTPLELAVLDSHLEQPSSAANAMQALTNDEPSMAWRSSLNEKLAEVSPSKRTGWPLKFAVGGLATAAASLAIFFAVAKSSSQPQPSPELGQELVQWHNEAVASKSSNPSTKNSGDLFGESVSSL